MLLSPYRWRTKNRKNLDIVDDARRMTLPARSTFRGQQMLRKALPMNGLRRNNDAHRFEAGTKIYSSIRPNYQR